MKAALTIQIPEPCRQSWDEMTPQASSRSCVDFSKKVTHKTSPAFKRILFSKESYKVTIYLMFLFSAGKSVAQESKSSIGPIDSAELKKIVPSIHVAAGVNYFSRQTTLKAEEIEKMAVRDIADQVSTTAGGYSSRGGQPLNFSGCCRCNSVYVIDRVSYEHRKQQQEKKAVIPKPKKWWQFWKRSER